MESHFFISRKRLPRYFWDSLFFYQDSGSRNDGVGNLSCEFVESFHFPIDNWAFIPREHKRRLHRMARPFGWEASPGELLAVNLHLEVSNAAIWQGITPGTENLETAVPLLCACGAAGVLQNICMVNLVNFILAL